MLAARLGAWLRHTGERWAKAAFAEKLAVLLALGAVLYTIVTGAAELRYQARAREALAQVKAARLAASAVSAQCYSAGIVSCHIGNPMEAEFNNKSLPERGGLSLLM